MVFGRLFLGAHHLDSFSGFLDSCKPDSGQSRALLGHFPMDFGQLFQRSTNLDRFSVFFGQLHA